MKSQWTMRTNMMVALWVITLCGSLWAGGSFRDDFSDGSIKDGSPVTWGWDDDGTGERLVDSEGLHLNSMAPYAILQDDQGNDVIYSGDMTLRMQLRMDSLENWGNTGMIFRAASKSDSHQAGIISNQLYLGRTQNWNWRVLSQPTIPGFSPTQQDIIIQIDVADFTSSTGQRMSRLEVYHWFPGQNKPVLPLISAVDATFAQGSIVLYADRCSVTFRWVEVITGLVEPEEPVVDFTGDGTVDIKDLVRLIESWGQEDPAVDIAPHPGGDGIVDVDDLDLLMQYWQQDVNDPTLKAHWTLDETEGATAYDSAGNNDALVLGDAEWCADLGQVNGALWFDGLDDSVQTPDIVNPADGAFSVFAWIKGGAPGQVILSQENSVNWLMADTGTGALRTDLADPVRDGRNNTEGGLPLISTAVITDDTWHRVGLVWDGLDRILYVDDTEVARDIIDTPESMTGGVIMGMGRTPESSGWTGMIDEVRIYNRAVTP